MLTSSSSFPPRAARPPHTRAAATAVALGLIAFSALLIRPAPASAGHVDPPLARHLATLPPDQPVKVLIMLAEQAPTEAMNQELKAEHATRRLRHRRVIESLRTTAAATQPVLLDELRTRRSADEVLGFTPHWIANMVVAVVRAGAIPALAARPDVGVIYADFTVSLIEPVGGGGTGDEGAGGQRGIGITPGLQAINAPRVWRELGITGAGRLVSNMDTGVYGSHPALQSRWRGNHVPWQHAWLDLLGGGTTFPNDSHGHGTHTMGTLTGLGAATGDTVGVAWGAEWIACNPINQGVGSEFDNDVIAGFEWLADPDGDPQTVDDVPDVVQNSWRINESFPGGYTDCDPRWWAAMDNCEAAGCAVVFSAGNEGPAPQTIGSPPDRITTPTNAFAIGAIDATHYSFPYPIAGFSSRGPSGCDGVTVKPEVVAPGVEVYSSTNDGGYHQVGWDGTSMAGPHVSGIFALMREADPDVDVDTMKEILMETAVDLGPAGEENTYGWGIVDAYAAVNMVLTGISSIQGTVTAQSLGAPVPGVEIEIVDDSRLYTTDLLGFYSGPVAASVLDVEARHPAFLTVVEPGVSFPAGETVVMDFALEARPDAVPPVIDDPTCLMATDDDQGPYPMAATVTDNLGFAVARLYYRTDEGAFTRIDMTPVGDDRFAGEIPGQPLGTTVEYYFEAVDPALNAATDPPGAPGAAHAFVVQAVEPVFTDDAEEDRGWTLGVAGDPATSGMWVRDDPVETTAGAGEVLQPEDDHTPDPGVVCFVTGNAPVGYPNWYNDVDGGCTTLESPVFDLSGAHEVMLRYWRWWADFAPEDDSFSVLGSSDGGASWTPLEVVTENANEWTEVTILVRCTLALTDQMRFRFVACDDNEPSLVEAAVDDVMIGRFDLGAAGIGAEARPAAAVAGARFGLGEPRPNPFNPSTILPFDLAARGHATLRLYDVEGRLVRTLVDADLEPGTHRAIFDGRADSGRPVAAGAYFVQLEAAGRRSVLKIVLLP